MKDKTAGPEAGLVGQPLQTFARIYDENVDAVYRYVHRRCQDHPLAEDITQDTFMTAVRTVRDPADITTGWLITVARNRLVDILRREAKYEEKLRLVAPGAGVPDEIDVAERLWLEAALASLPVHYRLVLSLHYLNGMTARAISEELDQTLKSVEMLIARARRALMAAIEEDESRPAEGGSA